MGKVTFIESAMNILRTFFMRGMLYFLLVAGVWVLLSTHRRLYRTLGIILLGMGLGLLGIAMAEIRFR